MEKKWIEKRLQELGRPKGKLGLAKHVGFAPARVTEIIKGDRKVHASEVALIADYLEWPVETFMALLDGKSPHQYYENPTVPLHNQHIDIVPTIGYVQAGVFQEAIEWNKDDWKFEPFPLPDGYKAESFYMLDVRGDSMNLHYPEGSKVVCCRIGDYHGLPMHGDHVIVHRRDPITGDFEATCKELFHDEDHARWLLMPRSTNEKHKPISIPNGNGDELDFAGTDDLQISGIVYAMYQVKRRF
jgi:repressor LexA